MMGLGVHIVFEGPEAVGKSTQILKLQEYLEGLGHVVVRSREPGVAGLGEKLRELLLDTDIYISPRAEALMMAADRAQNVDVEIMPALKAGSIVLSDRHVPSSLVYQGVVRGLGVDQVKSLSDFACDGHQADIVLCFDLEDGLAKSRGKENPDRMEREGEEFHQQVRDAYRTLSKKFRWSIVDAHGSEDEVFERIKNLISPLLVDNSEH
ncbi:MAG TPA: dTMP kinase [Acidimicrobiia bacterium]|nr:dTMP kinase [Acidimicrobiia bacterium]